MIPECLWVTSPFVFIHPLREGACAVALLPGQLHERFRGLSLEAFNILQFFLSPKPLAEALDAGIDQASIQEAIQSGLLMGASDSAFHGMKLWEDRRWSRAAYLLFSQLDLDYLEPTDEIEALSELSAGRRDTIKSYLAEGLYPDRHLVHDSNPLDLPWPDAETDQLNLDALVGRRSVRNFSSAEIGLREFSETLFYSSHNIRLAFKSQSGGDPYYLLNSFYSWLEVYLAVQGVAGVRRGIYQYDALAHQLRAIRYGVEDDEIISVIQHQEWIGGGGFCIFVGVHWERYMWLYRHSRAYVNLLIQVGEYGQELLQAGYQHGLGAWMTPAVTESRAVELLKLDAGKRDITYFLKFGIPGS